MLSLPVIKVAAQLGTMVSVNHVVGSIIANNVTISTPAQKIMVRAGALILSSMIVEQSMTYVANSIDTVAKGFKVSITKTEETDTPEKGSVPEQ